MEEAWELAVVTSLIAVAVLVVAIFTALYLSEMIVENLRSHLEKPLRARVEKVFERTVPEEENVLRIFFDDHGKRSLLRALFAKPKHKREVYDQSYIDRARQVTFDKVYFDSLESEGAKTPLVLLKFISFIIFFTLLPAIFLLLAVIVDKPFVHFRNLEILASAKAADAQIYDSLSSLDQSIKVLQSESLPISEIRTVGSEIAKNTVELQELVKSRTQANALLSADLKNREAEVKLLLEEANLLRVQSEEQLGAMTRIIFREANDSSLKFFLYGILLSVPLYWVNRFIEYAIKKNFNSTDESLKEETQND